MVGMADGTGAGDEGTLDMGHDYTYSGAESRVLLHLLLL